MNNVYNALNGNSSPFPKQNSSNKENNWNQKPRMSKEEFAQHMKEKKNELFNRANEETMKVVGDPHSFIDFLNLQAIIDYTVTNTLLVYSQNPKATLLKDFSHWSDANAYLQKGSKGIEILEPGNEYQRRDGSIGINYNPKTVFDVSSISNNERFVEKQKVYSPNEIVSSIIYRTEIKPEVVSNDSTLPEDVFFDEKSKTVYVKDGQDPFVMINGLLREYAFVECFEQGISRQEASFIAKSAGYLLSQKYHVDGYDTSFASECLSYFSGSEPFGAKKELERIKSVSSQISERMEHGLYALQQNRQPKQTERSNYER